LRICGEEGLHRVADWEDRGDLEVFVASDDGLLSAVFVPVDPGGPDRWELRIFFNAEIADLAWFPGRRERSDESVEGGWRRGPTGFTYATRAMRAAVCGSRRRAAGK
jgi:hypothetical protein